MALLDWILVVFGAAVALTGGWIQLHPERVIPNPARDCLRERQLDPGALSQIRLLGACFLCMGAFFTLQMTIDLIRLPWWAGTLSGLAASIIAVCAIHARVCRGKRQVRRSIQQPPLPRKALGLR